MFGRHKTKTEGEKKVQASTPTLDPSSISGTPRLLFFGNDMECQFCHNHEDWTYLYTRKQIYVCVGCAKALEAIMESNHRPTKD
jgi:hypothetical protein